MKTCLLTTILFTAVWVSPVAAVVIYDIEADWSDTNNPNGVWSFNQGTTPLSRVSNWALDSFTPAQGGWGTGSASLPFIFQSTSTANFPHDWLANDIIVHTLTVAGAPFNLTWTSPAATTIDITSGVWEARDIGRSNQWSLFLNNTLLSQGTVASGDPYSAAAPFDLATGTGGAAALDDVAVSSGDVIKLQLARTSTNGDYVGVNFTVTAIVPEPSTAALLLCGAAAFLRRRSLRTNERNA